MNEKPETTKCVLKLKLGTCLSAPTKRMAADFHKACLLQNRAANAMIRHWERWCEDNLFAVKEVIIKGKKGKQGQPPIKRTIMVRIPTVPERYQLPGGDKLFATELYHAGRATSPELSTSVVAAVSVKILKSVNKAAPPGHDFKRCWQGILGGMMARPCFRQKEIAVPNSLAKIGLTDAGYHIEFELWSKESGRANRNYVCRIPSERLPLGYKKILLKIAQGDWKLCDSKLHFNPPRSRREHGLWMLHLVYDREQEPLNLDKGRMATLTLQGKDADVPFKIAAVDSFPWKLGDVGVYVRENERLENRRQSLRERHRDQNARRGHGRQRVELTIRPITAKVRNLAARFQWRIVSEAVRYCLRYNCGTMVFDPPSDRGKFTSWFGKEGRPWDWTGFMSRLKHKLWVNGIELRESDGGGKTPVDSSQAGSADSDKGISCDGETGQERGRKGKGGSRKKAKK